MIESVAVHDRTLLFRSYFWLDFESHLADDPASKLVENDDFSRSNRNYCFRSYGNWHSCVSLVTALRLANQFLLFTSKSPLSACVIFAIRAWLWIEFWAFRHASVLLLSLGLCRWPSLFWLFSWPSIVPRSVFLSGSLAAFFVLLSARLACFGHNAVSDLHRSCWLVLEFVDVLFCRTCTALRFAWFVLLSSVYVSWPYQWCII